MFNIYCKHCIGRTSLIITRRMPRTEKKVSPDGIFGEIKTQNFRFRLNEYSHKDIFEYFKDKGMIILIFYQFLIFYIKFHFIFSLRINVLLLGFTMNIHLRQKYIFIFKFFTSFSQMYLFVFFLYFQTYNKTCLYIRI